MSVLIKGMDMPKDCWSCPMITVDPITRKRFCGKTLIDIKDSFIRLSNCPLVEIPTPHGRLIDGDELKKGAYAFGGFGLDKVLVDDINNAPTIIEAEEG